MSVVFSMTTDSSVLAPTAFAAVGGAISGVVKDRSDAVVSDAQLKLTDHDLHTTFTTHSDRQGLYSFPSVPVGAYELEIQAQGFAGQRKNGIHVDTDSSLRLDITLSPAGISESVTVSTETGVQVERSATHLGEVVSGTQITSLPLNGRSYTDLLAIQPGVTPATTLLPSSVIMAGVTGAISPSGDQNPGNVSINGQRESSNGFFVDGIDVQEHMNGGTSVLPNIDSLSEFRVLTNNFDTEYGNYNGGMITVVTRSGSDNLHGRAFDFFRNTALDARGYFDPTKSVFRQHQFGGAIGGPLARTGIYFSLKDLSG
jgi:hypothetical protein